MIEQVKKVFFASLKPTMTSQTSQTYRNFMLQMMSCLCIPH